MDHSAPLPLNALADELGDVRAEIRALRAREADLRQALIDAHPNGPVAGQRFEVVVREKARRVFDRDSLPGAILGDDRFWMIRTARTVVTRSCDTSETVTGRPLPDLWGNDSDLVLVEEF